MSPYRYLCNLFILLSTVWYVTPVVVLAEDDGALNRWTQPASVWEVNTEFEEWSPFLSADGRELYFSRVRTDSSYYGRLYVADRPYPIGSFGPATEVLGGVNETPGHVVLPWISPDGLRLYYHTEIGGRFALRMSERLSVDDVWPEGSN